jgi:hypothetical protein
MTVQELIAALIQFDPNTPVSASYDCGCAHGSVVGVQINEYIGDVELIID